jgi:hypothetical protein
MFTSPGVADAGFKDCLKGFTRGFKSGNQKTAEEILTQYKPYDQRPFTLTPVSEHHGGAVFTGVDSLHPKDPFILKVAPLFESMNDYYALKVLKEVQEEHIWIYIKIYQM